MHKITITAARAAGALLITAAVAHAQPQLTLPEPSPKAVVSQTIGIAEVQVVYHRPAVKGRAIWGKLVPYGEVWRAGADENTSISFSHPVSIAGKALDAGTYGLHMIPTEGDWTIIFSRNATSWGSFFYKESEDALRVKVIPQVSDFRESLQYEFSGLSDSAAVLSLSWEKLRIPIPIVFDTRSLILANIREVYLRGPAGFSWQGFNAAAQYSYRNGGSLTEALGWVDRSLEVNENFTNLRTKAAILEKMGNAAEAKSLRDRSLKEASEIDINNLGYEYLGQGKSKEAIELFERNVKAHPESWNVYDSLGEALGKSGNMKGAISNYEKALSMVKDDGNKKRITDTIAKLKAQ
ncbi:MAG TPA: DUF2911 domain-containing protein [Bacteroidota bacterium]|nr:DUF2911 domain-containing protein [Bacteroidota bacterium]